MKEHILITCARKELEELKRLAHESTPGASAYISNSALLERMNILIGMRELAKFEGLL